MSNYDLLECSVMGIADYIYHGPKSKSPQWMNEMEVKAWTVGFNRAKELCNGKTNTVSKNNR